MPESCIKCPICGRTVALLEPQSPFCSERCRWVDLGNWASGRYAIPSAAVEHAGWNVPEEAPDPAAGE